MIVADLCFSHTSLQYLGWYDYTPIPDLNDGDSSPCCWGPSSSSFSDNNSEYKERVNSKAAKTINRLLRTNEVDFHRACCLYKSGFRSQEEAKAAIAATQDTFTFLVGCWRAGSKLCEAQRKDDRKCREPESTNDKIIGFGASCEETWDFRLLVSGMLDYFKYHYKEAETVSTALSAIVILLLRLRWVSPNPDSKTMHYIWPFMCFIDRRKLTVDAIDKQRLVPLDLAFLVGDYAVGTRVSKKRKHDSGAEVEKSAKRPKRVMRGKRVLH